MTTLAASGAAVAAPSAARGERSGDLRLGPLPPLALYVHLPWCVRKCPYCDFNSYEARGALPEREYLAALLRDLDVEREHARGRPVQSVFIGGGTPSLFSGRSIDRLLAGIRERIGIEPAAEITLEANPGAVEAGRFAEFRRAGVNRLSIGAQSFRNEQLRRLGRVHDAAAARRAFGVARGAGFENVNLDLMYGLPGDDVAGALGDLATAAALEPEHLSWYQLALEPSTAFHRRPPALPAEDTVLDIERRGRKLLAERGYERYEISAYARRGHRCAHNLNYWQFGDYLGIGAGAHGKITLPERRALARRAKARNPRTYMAAAGTAAATTAELVTDPRQAALELLMNALRLPDGVDTSVLEQRAGQSLAAMRPALAEAADRGWLTVTPDRIRPTAQGLQMLNPMLELLC